MIVLFGNILFCKPRQHITGTLPGKRRPRPE